MTENTLAKGFVLVALAFAAGCAHNPRATVASADASTPKAAPDGRTVDSLMAKYDHHDGPGASVVVIQNGKVAYMHSYGLANVEERTPAAPATDFRLASLTKQFTATAIMLLVQDGKLRYDDKVIDLLPGFPAYGRDITVRHLLTHTSGLWAYEDFVPDTATVQVKDRDVLALIGRADSTYFPPGSAFRYSNTGYALLALIVEQVSGQRFASFLHDRIFAPLGMTGSVAFENGISTIPNRAYGYSRRGDGFVRTDQSSTSAVLGDGGIYTSVVDLVKWDHALESHALVSAEARKLSWTPYVLTNGDATNYGFGWFVDQDRGRTRLTHNGETRGFTNAIIRYPDQRLSVIVLTNLTSSAPWEAAQAIADLWLGVGATAKCAPRWPFQASAP
ncbi:MAG TPA: serine hydrolase domain-containing protein [Gemmatimonadaceae bacterium]|nr:serine hydrolase domain-containing protein [Gemmatimonadaceae bacterium]